MPSLRGDKNLGWEGPGEQSTALKLGETTSRTGSYVCQ